MERWIAQLVARLPDDVGCEVTGSEAPVKEIVFEGHGARRGVWVSLIYTRQRLLQLSVADGPNGSQRQFTEYDYREVAGSEESEYLKPLIEDLVMNLAFTGAWQVRKRFRSQLVVGTEAELEELMARVGRRARVTRTFLPWSAQSGEPRPLARENRILPWAHPKLRRR